MLGGAVRFGATYFHNNIKDLIAANATFTTNINLGRATTYGVESFVTWSPIDGINLRGDYTYIQARDDILHQELLRRPKHKASLNMTWQAKPALTLTASVLYVGSWIDGNRSFSVPRLNAPGYATVNLAVNYDATSRLILFSRITNLLDRRYENPVGFQARGIGLFAGVKTKF